MTMDVSAIVERARLAAKASPAAETSEAQREQLQRIAAEFESMLLVQVLKDMRRSGSWEEEGESAGLGAESLFETLDVELASHLARVKGLGLGKQLEEAFDRIHPSGATPNPQPPGSNPHVIAGKALATALAVESRKSGADEAQPSRGANPVTAALKVAGEAAAAAPKAVAQLVRPVAGAVTSAFGWRNHPITGDLKFHQGVDLRAAYGQDVHAAAAGKVVFSGEQGAYGSTVVVQHADGTKTRYAHLSARLVEKGDQIGAGEALGRAGRSGRATGTHLHFEVIAADGRRIQPDQGLGANEPRTETGAAGRAAGKPAVVAAERSIKVPGAGAD